MEPVARATVRLGDRELVADEHGAIVLDDIDHAVELTVTAPGYEAGTQTIAPGDEPALVLLWRPHALEEVIVVHAQAPRAASEAAYTLSTDEIHNLPGGGADALAAVRSLPGVGTALAGAAGS